MGRFRGEPSSPTHKSAATEEGDASVAAGGGGVGLCSGSPPAARGRLGPGAPPGVKKKILPKKKNHGRDAVTHYRVLERFRQFTYVECRLETGRTHQI
ncbi:MAG: pseudouridine synthase, partial [Collinsella sp.]|nr:pseudouridine synthase [Collinsella sp.]